MSNIDKQALREAAMGNIKYVQMFINPRDVLALLDELEAAEKRIAEQGAIVAAAEKLVRCKGRYHSEQNYRALAALFGVTTPDLPPLEHENVHYADAAEMKIVALRQRIAETNKLNTKLTTKIEPMDRQVDELTMWVKRLAHSLRNAKPDSKLHSDAMDYLSRNGLISVEDALR